MSILHDEIDQLRVQLAGCGAAAQGATNPEHVAQPGDWGWSPAYEDVLRLRRRFDKLYAAVQEATGLSVLPLPLIRALSEIQQDIRGQAQDE